MLDKAAAACYNLPPRAQILWARGFYYITLLVLLSSKICKKIAQIFIPKFVQNYYLFFIKNNDIINYKIKEGKTVGAENNSKNLKKVLTNKNSYVIINT